MIRQEVGVLMGRVGSGRKVIMAAMDAGDSAQRGEYLVLLRHGIRQSSRLAEQLATDPIVGHEARGLLGRLHAIRGELDGMAAHGPDQRLAQNDPFWTDQPRPFRRIGANNL